MGMYQRSWQCNILSNEQVTVSTVSLEITKPRHMVVETLIYSLLVRMHTLQLGACH